MAESVDDQLAEVTGQLDGAARRQRRPSRFPGPVWQVRVRTKVADVDEQLRLRSELDPALVARLRAQLATVADVLTRSGLVEWFRGSKVEYAWRTIHSVEQSMVWLYSEAELIARLPGYLTLAERLLPADHGAVKACTGHQAEVDRVAVQALLKACHEESDEMHTSARWLRNCLLGLSLSAVLVAALLLLLQLLNPALPLMPQPPAGRQPGTEPWRLLVFVMVAGLLGASISAIPPILRTRAGDSPYRLPLQQAVLKVTVGPLIAVVGIMIVAAGLVPAVKLEGTASALLGLAVIFGAGQQAVTRFADQRAEDLLGRIDPVTQGRGPTRVR